MGKLARPGPVRSVEPEVAGTQRWNPMRNERRLRNSSRPFVVIDGLRWTANMHRRLASGRSSCVGYCSEIVTRKGVEWRFAAEANGGRR